MKEIDFLPDWYRQSKAMHTRLRSHCIVIGGVLLIVVMWNVLSSNSISKAEKKLFELEQNQSKATAILEAFGQLESKVAGLKKRVKTISEIDSRIDVVSVLGELSYLVHKDVVFSKMLLIAEKFNSPSSRTGNSRGIRKAASKGKNNKKKYLGDVKFKVVINGMAADAGDVAEMVVNLEDSPYFFHIVPSLSKMSAKARRGDLLKQDFSASKFEVTCYLANYKKKKIQFAENFKFETKY